MNRVLILGQSFCLSSWKKAIKSSKMSEMKINSASGVTKSGVLASFDNVPIAYYDIPTVNGVVFSKQLWEQVHNDVKETFENHCHFGESGHTDESEVNIDRIAVRVNDFYIGDNNLVIANSVDILDTVQGRNVYSLIESGGMVGLSQRGFGVLNDGDNGTKVASDYIHVCWDAVVIPAVPEAIFGESKDSSVKVEEPSEEDSEIIENKNIQGSLDKVKSSDLKNNFRKSVIKDSSLF